MRSMIGMQRPQSLLIRTQRHTLTITDQQDSIQIVHEIKKKKNIQTKYLRVEKCMIHCTDLFIAQLQGIEKIIISQCSLEEQSHLEQQLEFKQALSSLQEVHLAGNSLTSIPSFVRGSPVLRYLNLDDNKISEIGAENRELPDNCSISVCNNEVTSIDYEFFIKFRNSLSFQWKAHAQLYLALLQPSQGNPEDIILSSIIGMCVQSVTQQQILLSILSFIDNHSIFYLQQYIHVLSSQICDSLLVYCLQASKHSCIPTILQKLLTYPQNRSKYIFERMLTLDPSLLLGSEKKETSKGAHRTDSSCDVRPQISLQHVKQWLNSLRVEENSPKLKQYLLCPSIQGILDRVISCERDLEYLFNSVSNWQALSILLASNSISFILNYSFNRPQIVILILQWDDCQVLKRLMSLPNNSFRKAVFHSSKWRGTVKPNWLTYRLLLKYEKINDREILTDNTSNRRVLIFPEYKMPGSLILRNDVHDYEVLREYQEFQASFMHRNLRLTVKYRNRESKFSIAQKILKQIQANTRNTVKPGGEISQIHASNSSIGTAPSYFSVWEFAETVKTKENVHPSP